jgi:hypothetical protein
MGSVRSAPAWAYNRLMKRLLFLLLLWAGIAGSQTFTYPCQECNNTFTGTNTFNGPVIFNSSVTLPATVVQTNQSNTWTTGTQDFSGVTLFKARVGAGLTTTVNGDFGYDTTNKNWHFFGNAVDNLNVVVPVSVTETNNDCAKWTVAAGVVTLNDNGGPCASTISVVANNFLTGYNATTGAFSQAQPSFGNISGSISLSQIVNLGTTTTVLHGNAAGNAAFSGVSLTADTTANQGTATTLLHGNAAGQPSFGSVVSADLNITTTTCTNQFVTAISATGVGTCTTDVLASAQHANQGTTTTLLHGNAAGNPTFAGVSLTADTTANQGTTVTVLHGNAAGQPSFAVVTPSDAAGNTTGSGSFMLATSATNVTFNTEGTGNSFTHPVRVWLPAAGCNNATPVSFWDLPTSTPAAAACVTGTNTQKGVLDYADTAGGFSAQTTELLPADFTGAIDARIIWFTTATTGNAKWSLSTICTSVSAAATDDPAFNTASTVTTAAPGVANQIQTSSITGVTITGCSAGQLLHVKLFRDGADAADTIAATARFYGLELTIRRTL